MCKEPADHNSPEDTSLPAAHQEVALILSHQLQPPQAPQLEVYNPPCSVGPIPKDKMVIKSVV